MRSRAMLCLFVSFCSISLHAQSTRHRAVTPPVPLPSTAALIDSALANGTINAEQALTYKVFADFADPRLPAQFHGDDSSVSEGVSQDLAAAQWSSLSQATKDTIGPFLVPPFYVGSWWDRRRAGATSVRPLDCRPWDSISSPCPTSSEWIYRAGAHVRIWFEVDHAGSLGPEVDDLINETETKIWPELTRVMGRTPRLETQIDGKTLLDVVLLDTGSATVTATTFSLHFINCGDDSTFIIVNRGHPEYLRPDYRRSFYAHELMHAVQHTYKVCVEPKIGDGYKWLMESTATWFEDELYPTTNREHEMAKYYLNSPDFSFDDQKAPDKVGRNYGDYLLFFYLTRIAGGDPTKVVRYVWEATEKTADAIHALKTGLDDAGVPLDTYWNQFAVYTWNRLGTTPWDRYYTDDRLSDGADLYGSFRITASSDGTRQDFSGSKLPHLSIRYYRFDFPDATASSVVFLNGLERAVELKAASIPKFGQLFTAAPLSDPSLAKGAHVDALLKIGDKWSHEDWTGKPFRTYCRDTKKERIDTMIVIVSNSDITNDVSPQGHFSPQIIATNIGCYAWIGTADLTLNDQSGRVEEMTVRDLRLDVRGDVPDDDSTPFRRMYDVTGGNFTWSAHGVSGGCSYIGNVFQEAFKSITNFVYMFPYAKSPAAGARGFLPGLVQEWLEPRMNVKQDCSTKSDSVVWQAGLFFLLVEPTDTDAQFASDGRSMSIDAHKLGNPDLKGLWTFTALRE